LNELEVKVNEDIQNLTTLTGRVDEDIQNLTTLLGDYSGTLGDVDDRLGELEDFVEGHVYHGSIETSDIVGLFGTKSE
jgi:archaellum component FlaC